MFFNNLRITRWKMRFSPAVSENILEGSKVTPNGDEDKVPAVDVGRTTGKVADESLFSLHDRGRRLYKFLR